MKCSNSRWLALPAAALALSVCQSPRAQAAIIYSDANDGFLEVRDTLPPEAPWPQVHGETFGGGSANVGEWYGPGLTCIVLPFLLPDLGAVADPFLSADFGVRVWQIGEASVTDIDLYGVRRDADPAILPADWYNGSALDPSADLIQESFLTPSSIADGAPVPNNFTDATGDANLLNYLNTQYAGGAGAGEFVFLRMSYGSDEFASGWDAYTITTSEAGGGAGEYPLITYTAVPEPATGGLFALASLVWLGRRTRRNGTRA